jgi:hypothetical protein
VISLGLCAIAFLLTYAAGRRSLVAGLLAVLSVGYLFGITRANFPSAFSHFIFDSAVLGLYMTQLLRSLSPWQKARVKSLQGWLLLLCVWPIMLLFVPTQDFLVQLVGLRGAIFLLPFMLFGARLTNEQWRRLALGIAVLNLGALGVAVAEYIIGVPAFFPRNAVTELIYKSNDALVALNKFGIFRIPSTFSNAHTYAGTMVVTLPLLLGAWIRDPVWGPRRMILLAGGMAAIMGVFMTAVRSHLVVMVLVLLVFLLFAKMRPAVRLTFVLAMVAIGWVVAQDPRFQRFTTLTSFDVVTNRLAGSVNSSLISATLAYPLGNGLGGGGTSLPYFLAQRLRHPVIIESEYARIVLETGLPGLLIWLAFIAWLMTRFSSSPDDPWRAARTMTWVVTGVYFVTGVLGIGLLSAIPYTPLFLMGAGWIAVAPQLVVRARAAKTPDPVAAMADGSR